jgi:outer membrane protein TolC
LDRASLTPVQFIPRFVHFNLVRVVQPFGTSNICIAKKEGMKNLMLILFIAGSRVDTVPITDTIHFHSIQAVWDLALKNNPSQKVYRLKSQQTVDQYRDAKSFLYPSVSGSFNGLDNIQLPATPVPGELVGRPGKTENLRFGTPYAYNMGITASASLLDIPSLLGAQAARQNILLIDLQQAAYEQFLRESTAANFFSALISRSYVEVARNNLQLADSLVLLARDRLDKGLGDSASLNIAIINFNTVVQNISFYQQTYNQSTDNLRQLTGMKPRSFILLDTSLSQELTNQKIYEKIGPDRNLDVYAQNYEVAGILKQQQKATFYPKLTMTAYLGKQQFRQDLSFSFNSGSWTTSKYIGLGLQVPLFNGFSRYSKYRAAKLQQDINRTQWEDAVDQSRINDQQLLSSWRNYFEAAKASEENFHLYDSNLALSKQKFEAGLTDISTYIKAFEDYLEAETTHVTNLSRLFSVQASIISRNQEN